MDGTGIRFHFPTEEEMKAKRDKMLAKYAGKYVRNDDPAIAAKFKIDLHEVDPANIINIADLPESHRLIYPGTPVTRDLRTDRLNLYIDDTGKVTNIRYH